MEALHGLAEDGGDVLLEHEGDGRRGPGFLLHLLIDRDALGGVEFLRGGEGLRGQGRVEEVVAPGHDPERAVVGIVGVRVEGLGVRIGIEIIRIPVGENELVLARAHLGEDLALGRGQQRHLDADRAEVGLDRRGDVREGLLGEVVERHGEPVRVARLGEQRFRLRRVLMERRFLGGAQDHARLEALVHDPGGGHDVLLDAVVIDGPFDRLAHLCLGEGRIAFIGGDIHLRGGGRRQPVELRVAGERGQQIGGEVAGDIGVPLAHHQRLARRVLHVADEDALDQRLGRGVWIGVEHHMVARRPGGELVGPGARRMRRQPMIAEVAVLLVGERRRLFDDAADAGGEAIEEEARRRGLRQFDHQRMRVRRPDHLRHIILGEAELGEDETGREVERHGALQGEFGVGSGQRIARGEDRVLGQVEGEGAAVGRYVPTGRDITLHMAQIGEIGRDELAVDIRIHLGVGEFIGLGGIEGDDVVDLLGDDENARRGRGVRCAT